MAEHSNAIEIPGDEQLPRDGTAEISEDMDAIIAAAKRGRATRASRRTVADFMPAVGGAPVATVAEINADPEREIDYDCAVRIAQAVPELLRRQIYLRSDLERLAADHTMDARARIEQMDLIQREIAQIREQIPRRSILTPKGWVVIQRDLGPAAIGAR